MFIDLNQNELDRISPVLVNVSQITSVETMLGGGDEPNTRISLADGRVMFVMETFDTVARFIRAATRDHEPV